MPKLVQAMNFLGVGDKGPVQRRYFAKTFSFNRKDFGYQSGYFCHQRVEYYAYAIDLHRLIRNIWRRERDSNPRRLLHLTRFPSVRDRPLCHLSEDGGNPSSLTQSPTPLLPLLPSRPGGVHNMSPSGDQDGSPLGGGMLKEKAINSYRPQ